MKSSEIQIQLEELETESKLKDLDNFKTEQDLKEYLETLDLSELLEIYYIQSCEVSRIRDIIVNSGKDKN